MIKTADRRTLALTQDAKISMIQIAGTLFSGIQVYSFPPRTCDDLCEDGSSSRPVGTGQGELWAPHVDSISMCIQRLAEPGQATDDVGQQLVAYLWDWQEYVDARDGDTPLDKNLRIQSAFRASCRRSFLAGWWLGTIGTREVRATNSGEGFAVPRQIMPNDQCSSFKYQYVLVFDWLINVAEFKVDAITDMHWRREGF